MTRGKELGDHRSRFVARSRDLKPGLLSALRVDDVSLNFADVLVTVCSVLNDRTSDEPWQVRLETVFQDLPIGRLRDCGHRGLCKRRPAVCD